MVGLFRYDPELDLPGNGLPTVTGSYQPKRPVM
ncbi:hypothetical protein BMS3Abin13_00086 [bacterium BMS3Abin13]|nr:hypothetical protein BMS3Abin13_00086 [bacterium BMS3Abin13]